METIRIILELILGCSTLLGFILYGRANRRIKDAEAGADGKSLDRAYENLSSGNPNCGICYSGKGESVLVVTVTTNVEEFADSIDHEKHHLAVQIADVLKWNLKGEEVCYLAGEIGRKMHPIVSHYLCENCRGH